MKISIDWISEFVDLPLGLTDRELSERVTLGVCEVDGYQRLGGVLNQVTVAKVVGVDPHPDADNLKLATVELGGGKNAVVVCGAPNCRPGIKAPYAAVGTTLPIGFTLEPKKIRGFLSRGMLCSEDELGLSDDHVRLMELASDAPVGHPLADVLGDRAVVDLLLDIDNKSLTHRPDCWGHYGLAREFAAVFQRPFRDKFDREWAWALKERIKADGGTAPVTIHVDPDSANRGFLGLSMDGVKVGRSPEWMRRRLAAAGMRPINTVVDISNYAMLETGIPNHIFDRTTIRGGKIIVRRAGSDQAFTTLDEQVRRIIASDTLVWDVEGASAIAGVMGGLESSVAEGTTRIMVEVANWTDAEIRSTSTRLGLRTDASQRYEKSLDSQQLEKCLLRIYELFLELNPGARAVGDIQSDNMPDPVELAIDTGPARIAAVLGENVPEERLTAILHALGFSVESVDGASAGEDGRGFTHRIHVPTWRSTKDIECEADIVEEVGRIIGYHNISSESPAHSIEALRLSPAKTLIRKVQDYLVLRGRALEVMTYPLVGRGLLDKAAWPVANDNLVLANAVTPDHDRMRPSMIPSLLQAAAENHKELQAFRIFECGRSYADLGGEDYSRDLHQVGIVFQEVRENPFIPLADTVEGLLSYVGLPGRLVPADPAREHPLIPPAWPGSHPHEFIDVPIRGISRGIIMSVHPQIARAFKIKGRTALAVLDFTEVMTDAVKDRTVFRPLDRFPGSKFDLTVVLPSRTYAAAAVEAVRRMKMKEIRSVGVLDLFDMGEGQKALTLHIEFRDSEKTLDTDFLKEAEAGIIAALDRAGYPLRT